MQIGPTKLLKDGAIIADYDLQGRLCGGSQNLDWDDNRRIQEAIANLKDNEDKVKDP